MATSALSHRDINALLNLTLPEEREKLHLTRFGVQGILSETLYLHGPPGKLAATCVQNNLVDQFMYDLKPENGNTGGLHYPLVMAVTQRPDGRWYLALGYLLLTSCELPSETQETAEVSSRFANLCRRYDIRGVRLNTSGYQFRTPTKPPK